VAFCFSLFPAGAKSRERQTTSAKEVFFWRAAMPEGTIKKVIAEKGFGFIATGRDDLFFHHSELRGVQIEQLSEGQTVIYEVGEGKKGPCAVAVQAC
jgi:CspA family cold shock protein